MAIKVVRSQEELGLHDDDPKGGCTYKDVLHSIILEINTLEVCYACGPRQACSGLQTCEDIHSSHQATSTFS